MPWDDISQKERHDLAAANHGAQTQQATMADCDSVTSTLHSSQRTKRENRTQDSAFVNLCGHGCEPLNRPLWLYRHTAIALGHPIEPNILPEKDTFCRCCIG